MPPPPPSSTEDKAAKVRALRLLALDPRHTPISSHQVQPQNDNDTNLDNFKTSNTGQLTLDVSDLEDLGLSSPNPQDAPWPRLDQEAMGLLLNTVGVTGSVDTTSVVTELSPSRDTGGFADPPTRALSRPPSPIRPSEEIDIPFVLSWTNSQPTHRLGEQETVYRRTLSSIFEIAIPYIEQAYEDCLREFLMKRQTILRNPSELSSDPIIIANELEVPSRMEILYTIGAKMTNRLMESMQRPRKRKPAMTLNDLELIAGHAVPGYKRGGVSNGSTGSSPVEISPPGLRSALPPSNSVASHLTSDDVTIVSSDDDYIHHVIKEEDEVQCCDESPTPTKPEPLSDDHLIRRIKNAMGELRERSKEKAGRVIAQTLECNICYRSFLRHVDIQHKTSGKSEEEVKETLKAMEVASSLSGMWASKCGHIYCRECLVSYFNRATDSDAISRLLNRKLPSNTKKKCPVCMTDIRLNDCFQIYL